MFFFIVVLSFRANSQSFSVLDNFGDHPGDPANPYGGDIVQGEDGNLYGTSIYGGTGDEGTIFKITPTGTLTVIYRFDFAHGQYPFAGLTLASDGNFYG